MKIEKKKNDLKQKKILDACCGSRMFWFDKKNINTIYIDNRIYQTKLCDGRQLKINPDIKMDFRNMKFKDKSFNLVVFDPPHLKTLGKNSWMAKKYGVLGKGWKTDLKLGFSECFRVLKNRGILIFKWNESQIKTSEILELTKYKPLFGHTSGRHEKTKWICFMKN